MATGDEGKVGLTEVRHALTAVGLFRDLSAAGIDRILAVSDEERFGEGTLVFREGELGDKLYVILEGRIRISRAVAGAGEETLATLGPGEAFGEMALIDDATRSADARADEACRLLTITREAFEDLLFIHKDLAYDILWNCVKVLCRRLRDANDKAGS